MDLFAGCTDTLADRGVTYCIEALTTHETNFIICMADAMRMVRDVDHPNFQTMLDCKAAAAEDKAHVDVIAEGGKAIRHVHVNDPNLRGPGFGNLAFTPIVQALKNRGYQGYLSVEVFKFDPDPQTIASRSIGYLRGILEALET